MRARLTRAIVGVVIAAASGGGLVAGATPAAATPELELVGVAVLKGDIVCLVYEDKAGNLYYDCS